MREWYRRPGNAEAQRESQRKSRERIGDKKRKYDRERGYRSYNVEKEKARRAINHALADGKMKKEPCEVCGSTQRIHGHHDDYSKPYEVTWLCPKHHGERHRTVN